MKTLSIFLLITLYANLLFARGYNRAGVNEGQLVLVYAALAAFLLLVGYAPEIWKTIKHFVFHKQHPSH